jgi:hypothetical protein
VETEQWFKHHSSHLPVLTDEERQLVEYLTGRIPLLLCSLFEFKGKEFNQHEFMDCEDLCDVQLDVTYSFEKKRSSQNTPRMEELYVSCLLIRS